MIVQLTGTLIELLPSSIVLDVGGVAYELGISAQTASALPAVGTQGVTLLTRLILRSEAVELYGFASRQERALFDRLIAVSGVGPKLALSVLSTFVPATLASVVAAQDAQCLARVPGVGKRKASRLLVELEGVFAKDSELRGLVGQDRPKSVPGTSSDSSDASDVRAEATEALLSMGFSPQEATLSLDGYEDAGANTIEKALAFALRRLGGGM